MIECSPAFKNCVQVTACLNIGAISGMNGRKWTKHGKLPYIRHRRRGHRRRRNGAEAQRGALAFAVGDVVQFTGNTHYTTRRR